MSTVKILSPQQSLIRQKHGSEPPSERAEGKEGLLGKGKLEWGEGKWAVGRRQPSTGDAVYQEIIETARERAW